MVVFGIILLVVGLLIGSSILFWIGVALVLIGLYLNFRPVGPTGTRRRYY